MYTVLFDDNNKLSFLDELQLKNSILDCIEKLTGSKTPNYYTVKDDQSLESWDKLKSFFDSFGGITAKIPVLENGETLSVFSGETNELMRYWHDLTHYHLGANFSFEGEKKTAISQVQQLLNVGCSIDLARIVFLDSFGQTSYYYEHKKFITDGASFVNIASAYGVPYAVKHFIEVTK